MAASASIPPSKAERVLAAATEVFLRYGFARATMGDIAAGAGVSRPALYLLFPNKEELFAAALKRLNDAELATIREGAPRLPTLRERLLLACEVWGAHGFDLLQAHPDAVDLFDLRLPPVRAVYEEFQAVIAELLAGVEVRPGIGATPGELARALTFAMQGFKDTAVDGLDFRRLVALQVGLVVGAIEGEASKTGRKPKI